MTENQKVQRVLGRGGGDGNSQNVPMIWSMPRSVFKAKRTKSLNNFAKRAKDSIYLDASAKSRKHQAKSIAVLMCSTLVTLQTNL